MENINLTRSFIGQVGLEKYPIVIGINIFRELTSFIKNYPNRSVLVICDSYFKEKESIYSKHILSIYT